MLCQCSSNGHWGSRHKQQAKQLPEDKSSHQYWCLHNAYSQKNTKTVVFAPILEGDVEMIVDLEGWPSLCRVEDTPHSKQCKERSSLSNDCGARDLNHVGHTSHPRRRLLHLLLQVALQVDFWFPPISETLHDNFVICCLNRLSAFLVATILHFAWTKTTHINHVLIERHSIRLLFITSHIKITNPYKKNGGGT